MKLSILICTLKGRDEYLNRVLQVLEPQKTDDVEILIESDERQMTIGQKRNKLLDRATGDYICYVDDDDLVSVDYIEKILKSIETNPDCVGIQGIITVDGLNPKKFKHSIDYNGWYEENEIYYRTPNHWNPVKREIASLVKFDPEKSFGEDKCYSDRLRVHLNSEVRIDEAIYYFLFRNVQKEYFQERNDT
tara:strand:- start:1065 stop:1637 length:573 start_codon:yes stop_codon:yes gene_type:complete